MTQKTTSTLAGLSSLFLVALFAMTPERAQSGGLCVKTATTDCANNGSLRTCSVMFECSGGSYMTWGLAALSSINVQSCTPTLSNLTGASAAFTLRAVAQTTAPATRTCVWIWESGAPFPQTGTVQISTADGLPVELLDFGIDPD